MKTAIYRFLINWYQSSDKPLPAWLKRACDANSELRDEQTFGEELTRSLKKRPSSETRYQSSDMTARVMRRITEENFQADQREFASRRGGFLRSAGWAVAACAVAILGFQAWNSSDVGPVPSGNGGDGPPIAEVEDAGSGLETLALQDALDGDWKNPLDQEIEYVISDAKGALNFLTSSFVPSGMLKKPQSEDQV